MDTGMGGTRSSVTWHSGGVPDELLDYLASLFVVVEEKFGEEPWWFDVRKEGIEAAKRHLKQQWLGFVVARDGDDIVGFGAMGEPVEGSVELSRIMVDPQHRRKHVGEQILVALRDKAVELGYSPWVDVLDSSHHAIALYEKANFETVSYQYGRDSGRLARQMRYKKRHS